MAETISTWLGADDLLWFALGVVLKSSLVAALGLTAAKLISNGRPDLRNLVLRQVMLLALVLPAAGLIGWASGIVGRGNDDSGWFIMLPAVTSDLISGATDSPEVGAQWSWQVYFLLIVLSGILFSLARIIHGLHMTQRIARQCTTENPADFHDLVNAVRSNAGTRESVRVGFSKLAIVPFAGGLRRRMVILPDSAQSWTMADTEMVLHHELLHINRRDYLWAMIGSLATALNWYNPLIRMANRSMVLEAERCCDAAVLSAGVKASDYASLLITLARSTQGLRTSLAFNTQVLGMKLLEVRIMSILQSRMKSLRISTGTKRCVLVCTLLLLLPLTAIQLMGADQPVPTVKSTPTGGSAADSSNWPTPDEFIAVDTQPERLTSANPVYPDSARKAGLQGSVWVKSLVDTTGMVAKAIVHKTSGHKILDDAALESALKSTFKPAESSGKKMRIWVVYEIKFKLKDK